MLVATAEVVRRNNPRHRNGFIVFLRGQYLGQPFGFAEGLKPKCGWELKAGMISRIYLSVAGCQTGNRAGVFVSGDLQSSLRDLSVVFGGPSVETLGSFGSPSGTGEMVLEEGGCELVSCSSWTWRDGAPPIASAHRRAGFRCCHRWIVLLPPSGDN